MGICGWGSGQNGFQRCCGGGGVVVKMGSSDAVGVVG